MFRMSLIAAMAAALVAYSVARAATVSTDSLEAKMQHVKKEVKHQATLGSKIAAIEGFRSYVTHELDKQRDVPHPTPADDHLALTLIGLDQDLGSYMDHPSKAFTGEECAGYRISLIQSYTGMGEGGGDRAPATLPTHTQFSLDLLDTLCKH